jgi:type IV pilus assembly protein PilX
MKPVTSCPIDAPTGQRGMALIVGLIFVVVLTLLGLAAMRTVVLEERMAGTMRDRSLALQAAEMTLRYAEQDISNSGRISGVTGFDETCANGLCYWGPQYAALTPHAQPDLAINAAWNTTYGTNAKEYGAVSVPGVTPATLPAGVPNPTYLIEGFPRTPPGWGGVEYYYRITVRAQGAKTGTVVWLEEVYKP